MPCHILLALQVSHMVRGRGATLPGLISCTLGVGLVCCVGRRVLHPGWPRSTPPAQHVHAAMSTA